MVSNPPIFVIDTSAKSDEPTPAAFRIVQIFTDISKEQPLVFDPAVIESPSFVEDFENGLT